MPQKGVNKRRKRFLSRLLLPFCLALLAATPFLLNARNLINLPLLSTIDNAIYDANVNIMRSNEIDPRVVIIDIDDESLLAEGQWPWPRDKMARLVNNLFNLYGVRVIGFDVIFAEPDRVTEGVRSIIDDLLAEGGLQTDVEKRLVTARNSTDTDGDFAKALASGPTVLGYIFSKEIGYEALPNTGELPSGIEVRKARELTAYPYYAGGYLANLDVLQDAATSGGFFDNPMVDEDGVYRRMPLLQYYNGLLYETLSLAVLRQAFGLEPPVLDTHDVADEADPDFLRVGDFRVPVDENLAVLVPYRGRQGSFPYVSATDVLNEKADIETLFDGIVLLGTTAPGLFDLRSTPVDSTYAGVEIHANIISGIMDGTIWHKPDWVSRYEEVSILFVTLLLSLTLPYLSPLGGALLVSGIAVSGVLINLILTFGALLVLPVASFVASTFFVSLALIGLNVVTERRKKRYLSRTFAKYVPRELVAQFEATEDEVTLEGENRDMSILFSDIRDFTSISEHLPPTELTQLMNEYLTPITKVIQEHDGNVDKYIGDAVMAFWGAPLENLNHPQDALDAAVEMQLALADIRKNFRQRGWPELRMGIGINSGEVNVGNMGSEFRTAYTVMGDTVNLASRLEGLSKYYDAEIVVSEDLKNKVNGYCFRELDCVRVKGKEAPVTIFEPVCKEQHLRPRIAEELDMYQMALDLYRQQAWQAAQSAFEKLAMTYPNRMLYRLYAGRCTEYKRNSPGEDWDGVLQMRTK